MIGKDLLRLGSGPAEDVEEGGGSPQRAARKPHQFDAEAHQIDDRSGVSSSEPGEGWSGERSSSGPPRPSSESYLYGQRLAAPIAGALWLGALASIATATPAPDLKPYPDGARSALSSSSGILLNEYDWGGYLIWTVPSRPVFVDGRLYPFAGNGVLDAYQAAVHVLPSWRGVIDRWNVAQALLRPDRALVQALRDDGWSVRAQGEGFVLLERSR